MAQQSHSTSVAQDNFRALSQDAVLDPQPLETRLADDRHLQRLSPGALVRRLVGEYRGSTFGIASRIDHKQTSWPDCSGHYVFTTKKDVDARHKAGHDEQERS